jgi:phospholipase C
MTYQLSDEGKDKEGKDKKKIFFKGRHINNPLNFIASFIGNSKLSWDDAQNVLGYYGAEDLPFFTFLADNYAICEQFFCSFPGPTMPNRVFSLTGDLQYDRTGKAILNNHDRDNLFLSRAMNIFDLLERKGIGWRVYESFPSVTGLRIFARYATNTTNIVDIARLEEDIAREKENFPAVTFIEPAMHHFPQNDDHASAADMWRGQLFVQRVYDALRSQENLWHKTMLVITYDEHGGFYDHVKPPIADILIRPGEIFHEPEEPPTHFTPSRLAITYGARVPTFIVSPWSPIGKGPDITLDFCSILKTIAARFCGQDKPFISARVNASRSLEAYVSETSPRMDVKDIAKLPGVIEGNPHPELSIITPTISREQMRSDNVDYHDLTGMLARLLGR